MAVPGTLRRWVSDIIVLTSLPSGQRPPLVLVPDAATSLMVRAAPGQRTRLAVVGPRTRASYYPGKDFPLCLRIRLRPGTARLLLGTTAGPQLILRHLEHAMLTRIAACTTADLARNELARAAASELVGQPGRGPQPVRSTARQLSVSERHLRNLFSDHIGLPPKHFHRIARIRRVLVQGEGGASRWAHLAAMAEYYDQSHMTAEFRIMMGVPPAAFFAGRLPQLQPC